MRGTLTAILTGMIGLTLSACMIRPIATDTDTDNVIYPATLTDVTQSSTRNLIRSYILDQLGPGYTVDLDQLSQSHQLIARDNGRSQLQGPRIPVPDRLFLLEISMKADGMTCWLKPNSELPDTPVLILPSDVGCSPILDRP